MQFSPLPCYLISLKFKYRPQHPTPNTFSLCSSLTVRDQVSHPHKTTGKFMVRYILIFILFYQTIIQNILVYGAEVWQIPTREMNKIVSTENDVLRRSARKSRKERIKN